MAIKVIEIPYKPRSQMNAFHSSPKRLKILQVHRRYGKTIAGANHLQKTALTPVDQIVIERGLAPTSTQLLEWKNTDRLTAYIAPFYNQAKDIAWSPLKYYSSFVPGVKQNESELSVRYPGGGVIKLFGADKPETFRGKKFWEVFLDEYQHHSPDYWQDDLRPSCFDTQAPITFAGTTIGEDHFYQLYDLHKDDPEWFCLRLKASESNVLDPKFLKKERELYEADGKLHKYLQEYELDLTAAIDGAIWGDELRWLRENNHIIPLQYDPTLHVSTYWDIGIGDYTVIWFAQEYFDRIEIIDCLACQNVGQEDVCKEVRKREYTYDVHHVPHDTKQREKSSGIQLDQLMMEWLPGRVETMARISDKQDDIGFFRAMHKRLYINSELKVPISALTHYARRLDDKRRVYLSEPKHDWTSHYADAMMALTRKLFEKIRLYKNDDLEYSSFISSSQPMRRGDIMR